ncbi:ABC transporter permease [Rhodococcus rhodochrous]|jgi:peptide/nickel transport system permease protein|uniref:ABC transporter permease n=1 Tax=Rhodococcus rhodochrous TaxID=1829 RepID=UPI001E61EDE1|nr:ABC transporter permease [Rhodococcus rhodochrous]MCB8913386.1 ABC transporter permease [Rhodococcus rhodochrous]
MDTGRLTRQVARRVGSRLAGAVAVVWGAATLSFVALHLIPGDPVDALLGPNVVATPQLRQTIIEELHLHRPVAEQYVHYLHRLAGLDFGRSYRLGRPVTDVVAEKLLPTVQLAVAAFCIAVVIALTLAVISAISPPFVRGVVSAVELIGASAPSFWVGIMAITVFSFGFGWFPSSGSNGVASLILPSVTLALPIGCVLAQVIGQALDHADDQPFATTVRARGVPGATMVVRHHLRHAAVPALTLSGWTLAGFLGGAVLIETVFARAGLGRTLVDAVTTRDIPLVTAITMLAALAFVVINLAVDTAAAAADPRTRTFRYR